MIIYLSQHRAESGRLIQHDKGCVGRHKRADGTVLRNRIYVRPAIEVPDELATVDDKIDALIRRIRSLADA